jgi:subtilisin family serine protease
VKTLKTILAAGMLALCAALPAVAGAALFSGTDNTTGQARPAASRQLLVMLRLPPQHYHPDAAYAGSYPNDSGRAARRRTAGALAEAHDLKLVVGWPMPVVGIDCYVMEQRAGAPLEKALTALSRDPRVMWAQSMNTFHGQDAGDPLYAVQPAARYWHLAELHKASTGRGVRIAVIDSGIDGGHPDLAGQVELRANFVDGSADAAEAHGTAVAGIIAARAGNGAGIVGVAPDARLLALRACWPDSHGSTRCNSFTLGKALNFAIMERAKIINLSLSGPSDRLLQVLLDGAAARGMVVVAAFDPQQPDGGFPASMPGVIAVAMAGTASASASVLLAPGADIPTAAPGRRWAFVSGSSYAAAHVTGLAALVAQLRPADSGAALRRGLVTVGAGLRRGLATVRGAAAPQATTVPADPAAQTGNIDACASLARITGACACSCTPIAAIKISIPHDVPRGSDTSH